MGALIVIARIISFAAGWYLASRYLVPSETLMTKPQAEDKKQSRGNRRPIVRSTGGASNSTAYDAFEWRKPILDNVVEALTDPNTHLIGVYGSDDGIKDTLLERVCRRVRRDKLMDMVLTVVVTKKPDVKKIQEKIAYQLGFNFNEKSIEKRADELLHRIKNEQKILIIILDLCKSLDLGKIGIPFSVNHNGCKILLTSTSEEVLSNQMHTQKNFRFDSLG